MVLFLSWICPVASAFGLWWQQPLSLLKVEKNNGVGSFPQKLLLQTFLLNLFLLVDGGTSTVFTAFIYSITSFRLFHFSQSISESISLEVFLGAGHVTDNMYPSKTSREKSCVSPWRRWILPPPLPPPRLFLTFPLEWP